MPRNAKFSLTAVSASLVLTLYCKQPDYQQSGKRVYYSKTRNQISPPPAFTLSPWRAPWIKLSYYWPSSVHTANYVCTFCRLLKKYRNPNFWKRILLVPDLLFSAGVAFRLLQGFCRRTQNLKMSH